MSSVESGAQPGNLSSVDCLNGVACSNSGQTKSFDKIYVSQLLIQIGQLSVADESTNTRI